MGMQVREPRPDEFVGGLVDGYAGIRACLREGQVGERVFGYRVDQNTG